MGEIPLLSPGSAFGEGPGMGRGLCEQGWWRKRLTQEQMQAGEARAGTEVKNTPEKN